MVEVNLKVVEANLRLILEEKPAHLELLLVVKDDALGHGIVPVAKLAATLGIKRFGVACLSEALALRAAGLLAPDILVFGERDDQELPIALRHKLTLQIQSLEKAERLNELAASAGQRAKVHLKVDSGMGRYGVKPHAVLELVEQISRLKNLELEGVMTHFAQSDEADKTYAKLQWERFSAVVSALEAKGQRPPLVHACNSGGYLDLPFAHGDMVRIGALLAGVYPSEVCRRINREGKTLAPALSLKSRVAFVKTLELGDKVGYGMHYTAPGATQLAILPLGYGDGYPRLRNKGAVLIQGTECPILGGNSMDAIMVDCSHLQEVSPGEEVVLIGTQGEKEITAMQLARWASTVTYQVLSCWTGRIEKRWV
ncbi:MAG: alanine racemase [Candidatus Lambdaproteobacteria bacterium RIFOXYD1_FULL_56_27]|uniref:Alanine racemase n=1 Tax=Candidatus Lambdaproteobacteria bacterium RIFOXYD2_FULL_56_26 TaxID=1817773 RepID=A0A1F6H430_9PROT|nr:MAG: alanine racemase [Candidatus Lambdaproteobacteria bacterium RIFOXYC1_FULL_56_13]OGH05090.1 MAG: alanine racemase [Candidatus Lambdaproteobacteria bacterium RIFOXYD2_FULL_56_26]OGH09555.1 MAG: alanine racemase [Candidatus Lambdaproteobacteria bacterium RIFOXYD1_FULL_56_27]